MNRILADESLGNITGLGGYNPTGTDISSYTSSVELIISNTLAVLSIIGGIMFTIYFLTGALSWITSGGDQGKVDKAKKMMTGAAIGVIIIGLSYGIAFIVSQVLGISILEPGTVIQNLLFNNSMSGGAGGSGARLPGDSFTPPDRP